MLCNLIEYVVVLIQVQAIFGELLIYGSVKSPAQWLIAYLENHIILTHCNLVLLIVCRVYDLS